MGLITDSWDNGNHTELNKLKFKPNMGKDHPGKLPLVTKRIPDEKNPSRPFTGNIISQKIDDLTRIGKLFVSKYGLKHLANETLLKRAVDLSYATTNTTLQKRKSELQKRAEQSGITLGGEALSLLKLIGSTVAQVGVAGTGTHFIRGLDKFRGQLQQKPSKGILSVGDQGLSSFKPNNRLAKSKSGAVDKINMISPTEDPTTGEYGDLIKFNFEVIRPDKDAKNTFLHFRAFLDSFSDDYTGSWNDYKYMGRGETFHTYSDFGRSISLGFKVAALTRPELRPIYQKLVYLASTTAPTYSGGGFMRGTIIKMTVGDYLHSVPGYITNINYTWNTDYPWEISDTRGDGNEENRENYTQQLPQILDVSLTFNPIHEFAPQTGLYHYFTSKDTSNEKLPYFEAPNNDYSAGVETLINLKDDIE